MADEAEEPGDNIEPAVGDVQVGTTGAGGEHHNFAMLAVLLGTPSDIDVADLTAGGEGEGSRQATFTCTQELNIAKAEGRGVAAEVLCNLRELGGAFGLGPFI